MQSQCFLAELDGEEVMTPPECRVSVISARIPEVDDRAAIQLLLQSNPSARNICKPWECALARMCLLMRYMLSREGVEVVDQL